MLIISGDEGGVLVFSIGQIFAQRSVVLLRKPHRPATDALENLAIVLLR